MVRTAVAVVLHVREELLGLDGLEPIMMLLKESPVRWRAEEQREVLDRALGIDVREEDLAGLDEEAGQEGV